MHGLAYEGAGVQKAVQPLGNGCGRHISSVSKVCMLMRTLLLVTTASCAHTTVAARAILLLPLRVLLIRLLLWVRVILLLVEGRVRTLALYSTDLPDVVVATSLVPSLTLFPMHDDGIVNASEGDLLEGGRGSITHEARCVDLNGRIHGRWELGHEHHPLDVLGDVKLVGDESLEVQLQLVERGDRIGLGGDSEVNSGMEVLVDGGDAGLAVHLLEVVPDLLRHGLGSNGSADARGEAQLDAAHGTGVGIVPAFGLVGITSGGRLGLGHGRPLTVQLEVGLHVVSPLEVVGAGDDLLDRIEKYV